MQRPRPSAFHLLAVTGLVLVLAGCGSPTATPEPSGGPSAAPSVSPSSGASPQATPVVDAPTRSSDQGGATSAPSPTAPAVSTCAPEPLDVVLGSTDSGAGSIDRSIVLTNRGSRPCTISGAPTVRMLTDAEEQLGAEATGSGGSGPLVRLAPGASAVAIVRVVAVGGDGGPLGERCTPARAVALAVDSTVYGRYDRLQGEFRGCTESDVSFMTVTPFRLA